MAAAPPDLRDGQSTMLEGIGGLEPPEKGARPEMEVEGGGRRGAGSGNGGAAVAVLEEEEQDLG